MSIDIGKLKHTLCATHISVQSRVYYEGEEISLCKMPLDDLKPKREWQGLTDEEIKPLCDEWSVMFGSWAHEFARAIEAKLREKNHDIR